ncbi:hypothetical protein ACVWWN_006803 [Mycobacterium sp. URHB0021]
MGMTSVARRHTMPPKAVVEYFQRYLRVYEIFC